MDTARAGRFASLCALAVAIAAFAWRWASLAWPQHGPAVAFSYDEATYADLARHPWHSTYYADPLFLRHPPVYFWGAAAWGLVAGTGETSLRLLALLCSVAGVVALWAAVRVRGGAWSACVAGVLLALAVPLQTYLVQATMYAPAFALLAAAVHAEATGAARRLRWLLVALALTHLFGFVYLAAWLWRQRPAWRGALLSVWPSWAWLAAATVLGLALHSGSDLIGLGPGGQAIRTGSVVKDYLHGAAVVHAASIGMTLLVAGPAFLVAVWSERSRSPLALGALLLCAYVLVAPQFVRYAVLLLPVLLAAGIPNLVRLRPAWAPPLLAALSLITLPVFAAYLAVGPDQSAGNDVPGVYDARSIAQQTAAWRFIRTPIPTAVASYLWAPDATVHAENGPNILRSGGQEVIRLTQTSAQAINATSLPQYGVGNGVGIWAIPTGWHAHEGLLARGWLECGRATGTILMVPPSLTCTPY